MSAKGLTIPTIFSAVDQMGPTLGKMGAEMDGFMSKLERVSIKSNQLFKRFTPALSETTKQILSYASATSVAFGVIATARFSAGAIMEYETAIKSLQAVTGVSNAQMEDFKKEIADLGRISKMSSIDITRSFETVGSMMSQYLEDPKGLRQITEAGIGLSKASRMELEPSLQALTSVMNQFQKKAGDAADVVNRLTAGEIVGSVKTANVAEHLQNFGAVAAGMNVTVGESVALIETLGLKLDQSKIGVGARNLLIKISSAGGLDKKARDDMKAAGVNMNFLMDKTQTLSARLHELAKISKDPIKMLSVFGSENITAGQTIFQLLGTYDEFNRKIAITNKTQEQAQLNTNTLSQALEQLKNKWVNMLTSSSKVGGGLEAVKNATFAIANNLENIISVGINVLKFYVGWKVVNIAMSSVLVAGNIYLGIRNALTLQSTALIAGNTIAMKASIITERAMDAAIALSTGNLAAFNAALAMSPLGWALIAFAALAGAVYLLSKKEEELRKQYEARIKLESERSINAETEAVKRLTAQYWHLGMGIKDATSAAIKFEVVRLGMQRQKVEGRITETKEKLKVANVEYAMSMGMNPAALKRKKDLEAQLYAQQESAKSVSAQQLGISQFAQSQVEKGTVSASDMAPIFKEKKEEVLYSSKSMWGDLGIKQQGGEFRFYIKNESNNEVEVQSGKTTPKTVMPQTTSTMTTK